MNLDELREAMRLRNRAEILAKNAKEEVKELMPPSLDGKKSMIGKLKFQSKNYYEHVDFMYDVLKRFDSTDVPLLIGSALHKLTLKHDTETDFCYETIMSDMFKNTRNYILVSRRARPQDRRASSRQRVHRRALLGSTLVWQAVEACLQPH